MLMSDLWYENTVIYCIDVETFMDSNGDGVGDFRGLTRRLDYLNALGINCIWLMPFFPSPGRDDGYDVTDYCSVDPRYGSLADFVEFSTEAKERGIRVVIDLVINHTSDQHPWFQAARKDPSSPFRDFYVWRTDDPGDTSDQVVFPGEQDGIWTWDEEAGAWYLHHFYPFQPDLNISNESVRDELRRIMGLWLELGVSGFRVDAAPFIINPTGVRDQMKGEPHQYLRDMRTFLDHHRGDAVFLAEVDEGPTVIAEYFGGGNEFHLLFNFLLNRDLFLALSLEQADPIARCLKDMPSIPNMGQWVNFLRHHDELNLSRLTVRDREDVYRAFGPDPDMQIFDRGLRRRLAPMLGGDRNRLELAYSLLFSLPGTPMIYYGEEIGMGEDLSLEGRYAVRTPMQWSAEENAGFSTAPAEQLVRPVVSRGAYSYRKVNVTAQRPAPSSLLNWMAGLIRARKECPEFGWGDATIVAADARSVFAHRAEWKDGGVALAVHNLSREPVEVTLDLPDTDPGRMLVLLGDGGSSPPRGRGTRFQMAGYGYLWLRVGGLR